jgi:hypothetical protein
VRAMSMWSATTAESFLLNDGLSLKAIAYMAVVALGACRSETRQLQCLFAHCVQLREQFASRQNCSHGG